MSQHQTVSELLGETFWLPNQKNVFNNHEVGGLIDKNGLVVGQSYCLCERYRDPKNVYYRDQYQSSQEKMRVLNNRIDCFFKLDGLVGNAICEYYFRCVNIGGIVSDRKCWGAYLPQFFWPLTPDEVKRFIEASRKNLLKHHAKQLARLDRDLASIDWLGKYDYKYDNPSDK